MFNPGWIKAMAALTGLGLIMIGAAVIVSSGDLALGGLVIFLGLLLAADPSIGSRRDPYV